MDMPVSMASTGYGVNVRSGPSTNYTVLGSMDRGEVIWVNSQQYSPWYWGAMDQNTKIVSRYGTGVYGFVINTYLGNID